jgi:hypothetical protein
VLAAAVLTVAAVLVYLIGWGLVVIGRWMWATMTEVLKN